MVLIGKLVLAFVAGAIPIVGITVASTLLKPVYASPKQATGIDKFLQGDCRVFDSVSTDKLKLLTCMKLPESTYYLYSAENNEPIITSVKSLQVKDSNNLLVVLEGETPNSQKTLTTKSESWTNFPKNVELSSNKDMPCSEASGSWSSSELSWTCTTKEPTFQSHTLSKLSPFTQ